MITFTKLSVSLQDPSVHMFALNLSVVPCKEILSHIALRVLHKFAKILEIIAFWRFYTYSEYLLCKNVSCSRITLDLRFRPFLWHHYSVPTNAVIIRICIAACHRSIAGKRLSKLTLRHSDETRKMSTRLAMAVKIVLLLTAIPFTWTQGPG